MQEIFFWQQHSQSLFGGPANNIAYQNVKSNN